jgi:hypothetical protein
VKRVCVIATASGNEKTTARFPIARLRSTRDVDEPISRAERAT